MSTIRPEEALAALASAQEHAAATHQLVRDLSDELRAERTPPRVTPFVITAGQPVFRDETRHAFASFTVVNPTTVPIYLGLDGSLDPRPDNRTPSVPAQSLITLPIPVEAIWLGADPALLATGDAVGWLLRHHTILTPFLGGS